MAHDRLRDADVLSYSAYPDDRGFSPTSVVASRAAGDRAVGRSRGCSVAEAGSPQLCESAHPLERFAQRLPLPPRNQSRSQRAAPGLISHGTASDSSDAQEQREFQRRPIARSVVRCGLAIANKCRSSARCPVPLAAIPCYGSCLPSPSPGSMPTPEYVGRTLAPSPLFDLRFTGDEMTHHIARFRGTSLEP